MSDDASIHVDGCGSPEHRPTNVNCDHAQYQTTDGATVITSPHTSDHLEHDTVLSTVTGRGSGPQSTWTMHPPSIVSQDGRVDNYATRYPIPERFSFRASLDLTRGGLDYRTTEDPTDNQRDSPVNEGRGTNLELTVTAQGAGSSAYRQYAASVAPASNFRYIAPTDSMALLTASSTRPPPLDLTGLTALGARTTSVIPAEHSPESLLAGLLHTSSPRPELLDPSESPVTQSMEPGMSSPFQTLQFSSSSTVPEGFPVDVSSPCQPGAEFNTWTGFKPGRMLNEPPTGFDGPVVCADQDGAAESILLSGSESKQEHTGLSSPLLSCLALEPSSPGPVTSSTTEETGPPLSSLRSPTAPGFSLPSPIEECYRPSSLVSSSPAPECPGSPRSDADDGLTESFEWSGTSSDILRPLLIHPSMGSGGTTRGDTVSPTSSPIQETSSLSLIVDSDAHTSPRRSPSPPDLGFEMAQSQFDMDISSDDLAAPTLDEALLSPGFRLSTQRSNSTGERTFSTADPGISNRSALDLRVGGFLTSMVHSASSSPMLLSPFITSRNQDLPPSTTISPALSAVGGHLDEGDQDLGGPFVDYRPEARMKAEAMDIEYGNVEAEDPNKMAVSSPILISSPLPPSSPAMDFSSSPPSPPGSRLLDYAVGLPPSVHMAIGPDEGMEDDNDRTFVEYDNHLPSSSPPTVEFVASSPPRFPVSMMQFTSSDDQDAVTRSSPAPELPAFLPTSSFIRGKKRFRDEEEAGEVTMVKEEDDEGKEIVESPKRQRNDNIPLPRRPTWAAQKLQHKKLIGPFKSPLVSKIGGAAVNKKAEEPKNTEAGEKPRTRDFAGVPNLNGLCDSAPDRKSCKPPACIATRKIATAKATSQFKSPISCSSTAASGLRLTPAVQGLERKLQGLKRAVKIRRDEEEEKLEELALKWRNAGRDVAQEVWDLIGAQIDSNGGWVEDGKTGGGFESNWGWSATEGNYERGDDEGKTRENMPEEEEKPEETLGTMLRKLGVAPETLGWDEEEGGFVDS